MLGGWEWTTQPLEMQASHTGVKVQFLAPLILMQLPSNKTEKESKVCWGQSVGGISGSWFQPGPDLAVPAICRGNQQTEDLSLSPLVILSVQPQAQPQRSQH